MIITCCVDNGQLFVQGPFPNLMAAAGFVESMEEAVPRLKFVIVNV